MKKMVKYANIPLSFRIQHQQEAEDFCDSQTLLRCYCGRLATGMHTRSCRKYRQHVERFVEMKFDGMKNG